jgi:hypothetical protein
MMAQLLLVVRRVGDGAPTAKVSVCDAAAVGQEFRRGSIGHSFNVSDREMAGRFACDGWEDVKLFLRDEGHLHHFQPWINGVMDRVTDATGFPGGPLSGSQRQAFHREPQ